MGLRILSECEQASDGLTVARACSVPDFCQLTGPCQRLEIRTLAAIGDRQFFNPFRPKAADGRPESCLRITVGQWLAE